MSVSLISDQLIVINVVLYENTYFYLYLLLIYYIVILNINKTTSSQTWQLVTSNLEHETSSNIQAHFLTFFVNILKTIRPI